MSDERDPYTIQRYREGFAIVFNDPETGKRRRFALGSDTKAGAKRIAPVFYARLTRPKGTTVADLWKAYTVAKHGKSIVTTMQYTWKAIGPHFGNREGQAITLEECRSYTALRREQGRSDGTIHTELGHLRTVLSWAVKYRMIDHAPHIERPKKPEPKDRYLTREEVRRMIAATTAPHTRLAIHLMLATAARVSAVLELTWDRVDFNRRLIHLRDPEETENRKGRATVPMTRTLFAALKEAQAGALSEHVVEWGGEKVTSIKRSIKTAARAAGLEDVSPHVMRHTAAVLMAEAGRDMEEISQYLGHTNPSITRRVYARYSPDHLRKAAEALELDEFYEVKMEQEHGIQGKEQRSP